ncbi:DEAD/DEAH box helicase [Mycobacteroides abscessus]|uniref:DEAD/DEAH box helicase n=1 Tax=Mycobacteroides abscessus TaxID=36809 RepID=UPI0009A85D11|nr:DEAD/DEAH box helicase [Mycobacteroides abscessus]SLH38575.1 putative helicase [Mycobacteroides abscessus subsp. massiliense]
MLTEAMSEQSASGGAVDKTVLALRPHQRRAYEAALEHLDEHSRVTICLPCGTGKTLTGQRLAQNVARHGRSAILVLVPTIPLLRQTLNSWKAHSRRPINAFVFCHDRKISTAGFPVPVATRPQALAEWMKRAMSNARPTDPQAVVFATYHSSPKIAAAHNDWGLPPFHVTVADEAHRTAGELDAAFATVVDDTKIQTAVRVFLTATLRVRGSDNSTALCMENEAAFGPVVSPLGVRDAINQGLLSDYEVAIVTVTDDDVREVLAADGSQEQTPRGALTRSQLAAVQVATGVARRNYGSGQLMVFHNRVETSKEFTEGLPAVVDETERAGLSAMHVDANTETDSRDQYLETLENPGEGRWAVLSSVRCLGEGIDVPSLDGIVFAAPRTSTIDITQCVGRALRPNPDRPGQAVIVLPVYAGDCADASDLASQVARSAYKHVYRTLVALADQDSALAGELTGATRRAGGAGRGGPGGGGRISILDANGDLAAEELRAALTLRTLKVLTPGWDFGYQQLSIYVEEHGDCDFTAAYVTELGFPLGAWVRGQRQRREALTSEQREKLEAVAGWTWNKFESAWMESYRQLAAWAEEHGHVKIPRGYRTPEGFCMDQWPTVQRREYRAGTLDPQRIALMEALPGWNWNPGRTSWDIGYGYLEAFIAEFGSSSPSQSYEAADGYRLGNWVSSQRREYQAGRLSKERVSALEALPGWTWLVREARWRAGLAELVRYRAQHGHLYVPQNYVTKGGDRLGVWVSNQRVAKHAGTLSAERIEALEAFEGWSWWGYSARQEAKAG